MSYPLALASVAHPPTDPTLSYWDNACSFHTVHNATLLYDLQPLPTPFSIGGVGGSCAVTHRGYLHCLPTTNDMNSAYLSPTLPVNLFSLGQMQRSGATYDPDPLRPLTHVSILSSPSGPLLAHATLSPHNLLPVNFDALHIASKLSPTAYHPAAYTATFHTSHINAEQQSRADAAEELHNDLCHPSDRSLCVNLTTGKLSFSTLTCSDVTLNRHLRGPCPHCAAGKHRNPPHPPSTTAPATSIGAVLSFDPQLLPEPSPGLHTHEIILVDEFSGHLSVVGASSKSTPAIFKALQHVIASTYNSHQHRVYTLHGDCEKINTSLAAPLGSLGIALHTSPPGEHAARVERSILTLRQLTTATLSSLPYHLPLKYTLYLHKAIATTRNTLINTRSSPSTPDELLRGSKPTRRPFPFGTCCMVTQHADKRHSLARTNHTAANAEPKAELGVCVGPDLITGRTLFLLANGSIVPRRPTTPIPPYFIPFDWTAKPFVLRTTLPDLTPSAPPHPDINTVIQLPATPHAEAIASVTGHIPSPLPADLIYSIQSPTTLTPPPPAPSAPSATPPSEPPPTSPSHRQPILEDTQLHQSLPEVPLSSPSQPTPAATAPYVPSLPPPTIVATSPSTRYRRTP